MRRPSPRPLAALLPILASLALVLAGCGGEPSRSNEDRTVKIGLIAPLSGPLAEIGIGMRNSIELAVRQANERGAVPGWRIVLEFRDDAADAARGEAAARELAADPRMAGVVGTVNSNVAQGVAPVLAAADIVQISPANTNPTLSRGPFFADAPRRVWHTYHRVATTDALQGPFAADYAFNQAGMRKVAVVHNNKTYGQGLVAAFEKRWKELGGTITAAVAVNPGQTDVTNETRALLAGDPEFIYYGGEHPEGVAVLLEARRQGFNGVLMSGDGLFLEEYITAARAAAAGTLVTSIGEPVTKLPSAKRFIDDYNRAGFGAEAPGAFGPLAHDATNIIIEALARVLPEHDSVAEARPAIVAAVNDTTGFAGVTGEHTFDEFGDTSNKALTVYRVADNRWTEVFSGVFEQ